MRSPRLTTAILLIPAIAYAHGGHGGSGGCGGGGFHSGGHSSGGGGGGHSSSGGSHVSIGHSSSAGHSSGGGSHVATSSGPHPGHSAGATSTTARATRGGAAVDHNAIGAGHDAGKTEHGASTGKPGDHGHPVARTQHRHHRRRGHVDLDGDFVVEDVIVDDCGAVIVPDDAPAQEVAPEPPNAPPADDAPPGETPPADDAPADPPTDDTLIDDGCTDAPVAVADADQADPAADDEPVPPEAYDANGAPSCIDDSTVVGYRRCTPFARWDAGRRPPLEIELGTSIRSLDDRLDTIRLGAASLVGPGGRARDVAVTSTLRVSVDVGRHLYLGFQSEAGGLVSQATPLTNGDITPSTAVVVGGDVFAGVRGGIGRWRLATEIGGGAHLIGYAADTMDIHASETEGEGVLELRVRAQYWLHPFIAISASAGANTLVPGEWSTGLGLVVSTRAFGGGR